MYKNNYKCRACLERFSLKAYETEEEAVDSLKVPYGMYAIHHCEGVPKWIGIADFIGFSWEEGNGQEEV